MRVILGDSDPGAMEALADHIRRAEPQAEIAAFASREELARWMEEDGGNAQRDRPRLRVQTFGNFEVFYDGKPVHFRRRRTKELFAYLIDRRGAGSTMGPRLFRFSATSRPQTGALPRNRLASPATGGASPLSPSRGQQNTISNSTPAGKACSIGSRPFFHVHGAKPPARSPCSAEKFFLQSPLANAPL